MSDLTSLGYTTIVSYISYTLLFFVIKSRFPSNDSDFTWVLAFFIIGFLLLFMNNLYITSLKQFCGKAQPGNAFASTLFPWVFIFGIIVMCLLIFPGWLRIFSNTFGLSAARAYGLKEVMNRIFSSTEKLAVTSGTTDYNTLKMIESIYSDPTPFINELEASTVIKTEIQTREEFNAQFESLRQIYKFDKEVFEDKDFPMQILKWPSLEKLRTSILKNPISQPDLKELHQLVQLKDSVAYFIWFLMAGSITIMISTNSLLNAGCNGSVGTDYEVIFNNPTPK